MNHMFAITLSAIRQQKNDKLIDVGLQHPTRGCPRRTHYHPTPKGVGFLVA